jgi:hypothetical protein
MIIDLQIYQMVKDDDKTPNGTHIPEVDGSIPLPPTNNDKGLAITPFLFLGPVSKWRHGFLRRAKGKKFGGTFPLAQGYRFE